MRDFELSPSLRVFFNVMMNGSVPQLTWFESTSLPQLLFLG